MRKRIFAGGISAALVLILPGGSGAAWPPYTSIESESGQTNTDLLRQNIEKLRKDERRLAEDVKNVDTDEKEIRRLMETLMVSSADKEK